MTSTAQAADNTAPRRLTGWHVLAIAVLGFGTVIGANVAMLLAATGSFPGLVVESAYREGRGWDERATAQAALGWEAKATYTAGALTVQLAGPQGAVADADLGITIGRPATDAQDRALAVRAEAGAYVSDVQLAPGRWQVEVKTLSGPAFQRTLALDVPGSR